MKKILLFLGVFLFTGCGQTSENNSGNTTSKTASVVSDSLVEKPNFTIRLPQKWHEHSPNDFRKKIDTGEIMSIFQREQSEDGVFATIVISQKQLGASIAPIDFARALLDTEKKTLFGFQSEGEMEISGSETTILTRFLAQSASGIPPLRFWQTFLMSGQTGIIVTGTVSPNSKTETQNEILQIVKSVKTKELPKR